MLVAGFAENWPNAWPDLDSALSEVQASLASDRISRVAIAPDNTVLGWIGGIRQYNGNVWELHPLVVRPDSRGKGIGSALVRDLENKARQRGGLVLWVGTDDENNTTTLGGLNLYPNVWQYIAKIQNLRRHP